MAVLEMEKIHILASIAYQETIVEELKRAEILDLSPINKNKEQANNLGEISRYELKLSEIKAVIMFLSALNPKKKDFIESFIPEREEVKETDFREVCRTFNYQETIEKCEKLEAKLNELKTKRNEIQVEHEKLLPWQSLNAPLELLTRTEKTCLITGKIKTKQLDAFVEKIHKFTSAIETAVVNKTKEETFLIVICLESESTTILDFLSKSDFTVIALPASTLTPQEEIQHLKASLKETEKELHLTHKEAAELSKQLLPLKLTYDSLLGQKHALETKQKLLQTDYAFILEGWTSKADLPKIKEILSRITKESELFILKPAPGETIPIAIKNPGLVSPFELITKIYALPKPHEFDPTILLSFFFILFFGICLGDFIYGIVLSLVSAYFLKRYRLPQGGKNLFELLFMGGIVAAVAGVLTGSYLGFAPSAFPAIGPLKNMIASLQIIDPVKDPVTMLIFSLALGVIQIFFGKFISLAGKIKNGDLSSAILDDFFWIFFLGSLVGLIVSFALSLGTVRIASYFSIIGAVALIISQGRHEKTILKKILIGVLSLYTTSSYLGDTLSYSRLLALGMSTTIIGTVINILAAMTQTVPVIGIVLMLLIMIIGHAFNLIIGVLGAFVHSARLQLVEFFGKFYEGGGREFRPFKRVAEYTILK
ncbi:MAG: hypothetical protein NT099_08800 [Candidatus Saganbacteria bacterium]|nr:hypothetical protein [Candidatus Saganbacteria bacterium]